MHIVIITTPNEALKESGFGSLTACTSFLNAVKRLGYTASLHMCSTKEHLDKIIHSKPDLAIPAVKYIPLEDGNDIWLSDYLSQNEINFTGSSRDVLKFDSSKELAKKHLAHSGIKTASYFLAVPEQYKHENELPIKFPLFLKPSDAANGNGIDDLSYVTNFVEFESKLASLYSSFNQPVLVEQYLDGPEFTVAVINTLEENLMVSAVEVIPPESTNGLRILGAKTKQEDSEILKKIENNEIRHNVTELAINAFMILGVRDFGRIDIKTSKDGTCYFMEANLVPGMTFGTSYFPQACNIAHELAYIEVIEQLLVGGLSRATLKTPPNIQPIDNLAQISAV